MAIPLRLALSQLYNNPTGPGVEDAPTLPIQTAASQYPAPLFLELRHHLFPVRYTVEQVMQPLTLTFQELAPERLSLQRLGKLKYYRPQCGKGELQLERFTYHKLVLGRGILHSLPGANATYPGEELRGLIDVFHHHGNIFEGR